MQIKQTALVRSLNFISLLIFEGGRHWLYARSESWFLDDLGELDFKGAYLVTLLVLRS